MPLILPLTLSSLQEWSREIGEARKLVLFVLFVDVVTESPKLLHVAHKMDLHRCVVWKVKWTLEILSPFLNSQYDSACSISQLPVWQRMLHFSTHSMTAHAPFLNSQYDSACSISQLPVWERMLHFSTHSMTAHAPFLNCQYDSACSTHLSALDFYHNNNICWKLIFIT